jgi:phosphatidylserine/phosphatidylglycerophosphate/cardiolipin synthase-like enzyme
MPSAKRKRVNLNSLVESEARKKQKVCGNIHIHFDGAAIVAAICRSIRHKDTVYVMGCSAWFTNATIISCMASNLKGCCVIVTKDKLLRAKTTKAKYRQLPVYKDCAIRVIGSGSGYNKSLMHHKYLVGMGKDGEALWVSTGSFNMTQAATKHLENCMVIQDPSVAQVYLDEFVDLYKISKPLKL